MVLSFKSWSRLFSYHNHNQARQWLLLLLLLHQHSTTAQVLHWCLVCTQTSFFLNFKSFNNLDEGKLSFGLSHLLNAQQLGRITLRTMLLLLEIARQKAHQKAETEPAGSQRLLLPSQQQAASRVVPLLPAPKPEMKVVTATAPTTTALSGNGKSSPFAATTTKKRRLSRRQLAAFSATHIDTVEIVTRVKALLVDRAIGQRLFGAAVLGLSQGSVSQLLADPKPWEALNFGREPYIRMVRWLEALPRSMDLLQEMKAVKLLAKMKKVEEEEEEKELFQPKWVLGNSPAEASAYFWSHFEEFEDFGAEEEEEENQGEKVGGDDQEVKVEDNKEKKKGVQSPPPKPSCPRPRRRRHHFTREQLTTLRDHFRQEPHPRPLEMQKIAERLGLKYRHIDAWFHNNRVRGSRAVFALSPVSTSILTSTLPSASVLGKKNPATELVGADHEASSTEFGSFNSSSSPSSSSVSSNSYSNFAFSNY